MNISQNAQKSLESSGGSIQNGSIVWPEGTRIVESSDRGGWGNFSYREWMMPNGCCICWDSDDRQYQLAFRRAGRNGTFPVS